MNKLPLYCLTIILGLYSVFAVCGDGICQSSENKDTCSYDCYVPASGMRSIAPTYRTTTQVYDVMKAYATRYPSLVSYESIGKSINGKDILIFKIGNPNGGRFMFDGRVHGPEDCGTETGIKFVDWVLTSSEQEAKDIREKNYLLFVPVINVDNSDARQNDRRLYPDGTRVPYGVDLNRNFVTGWGTTGSGDPNNNYEYRGQSAGSEPETKAMKNAFNKFKPQTFVNVHCGGRYSYVAGNRSLGEKVLQNIREIGASKGTNTYSLYNPKWSGGTCGTGGYVYADGCQGGYASTWLLEISTWDTLPAKLEDYHTVFYDQVSVIYLSLAKAVQTTNNPPSDPCAGITCPNKCSGSLLQTQGRCVSGSCVYTSTNCPYGCSNAQCLPNIPPTNNTNNTNPPNPPPNVELPINIENSKAFVLLGGGLLAMGAAAFYIGRKRRR